MQTVDKLIKLFSSSRLREIDRFRRYPALVQEEQLRGLLRQAGNTVFGREYALDGDTDMERFRTEVPVSEYEKFRPWIERARSGEKDVLYPGTVRWFAKSSGTTDAESKYIPVSRDGLWGCHMRGMRDVVALFTAACPGSRAFSGRMLTLGGSIRVEREGKSFVGDLSAVLLENTPRWANMRRVPSVKTALIPDFEEKVRRICSESVNRRVTSFAGVPSWNLVMMNRVLEYTGKNSLLEVWPELELFVHGGMSFKPYSEEYRRMIPSPAMKYMETYNASEGFFSIADDPQRDDMLLMLDYGMFYEFLPVASMHDASSAVPLEGVRTGINYAMIITNSNGLWRYLIGDTVEFTSLSPCRIRITGRTKHYINAFGEEIIIDNAETAIREACDSTGAEVTEYTAAPVYMKDGLKGAHQWVVEFGREPDSLEHFGDTLDKTLQKLNSDYAAKRFKDTTLRQPVITVVEKGTFTRWMGSRGKLGGQNKVPRLYNDRTYVDMLLNL